MSSLYRQVQSYTALFNVNSVACRRPVLLGGTELYDPIPGATEQTAPRKPLNFPGAARLAKGQLRDREN